MSDEGRRRPRKIVYIVIALLLFWGLSYWLVVAFALFEKLGLHWTRLPPTMQGAQGSSRSTNQVFENVRETLRKDPGLAGCRSAINQLNGYSVRDPDSATGLSEVEQECLRKEFHLAADDLAEVSSVLYTPLDAYHLDQCLLLNDAARSLGVDDLPARDRALAGFGWAMRQVRLQEEGGPASPPSFVVRRGWGTACERVAGFSGDAGSTGHRGLHGWPS